MSTLIDNRIYLIILLVVLIEIIRKIIDYVLLVQLVHLWRAAGLLKKKNTVYRVSSTFDVPGRYSSTHRGGIQYRTWYLVLCRAMSSLL